MTEQYQQALAAMPVGDVEFILSQLQPESKTATATMLNSVAGQKIENEDVAGGDDQDGDEDIRRRRHIEREWPDVGTVLSSEYFGATYTAEIIPASKKLKSGKQIRITSGPTQGTVCDSFSEAMVVATEIQRNEQSLGRKGASNGWVFWDWPGKPENIVGDDQEEQ